MQDSNNGDCCTYLNICTTIAIITHLNICKNNGNQIKELQLNCYKMINSKAKN